MKCGTCAIAGSFFLTVSTSVWPDAFENGAGYFWANTPQGRFECAMNKSTQHLQVLKLDGKVIFQQKSGREVQGGILDQGISVGDVFCPDIIANQSGYVIVARSVQPPSYGLQDYAVINFNDKPASFTELIEAQNPKDARVPETKRVVWDKTGFTLTYFGYKPGEYGGSVDSPKPRMYKIRLDFATDNLTLEK